MGCYLSMHKIAYSLNTQQCESVPFFLTGCDTISFYSGKGKKTAFQAWKCYPEDGYRLGQPYLRLQKRTVSSSDVAVSGHTGNFASAPRQTSLALRCALAVVIVIKITL